MRRPFGDEAFDYVLNMFTSFGYFAAPSEHVTVLRNVAAALRPGGTLVLDYLNVRHAESRQVPSETKEIGDVTYRVTRWHDATHFYKRIEVDHVEHVEHVERVAPAGDSHLTLGKSAGHMDHGAHH